MKVIIVPYNPEWPAMFEQEKARLKVALGGHAVSIQHIGSTAVPGLGAKPIIDVLIAVPSLEEADAFCIQPMIGLGYEYVKKFEQEIPHRRYFRKSDESGVRTHHVHMAAINSDWWVDHLLFRDFLRADGNVRRAYEAHKHELAEYEWNSGSDYAKAKTEFILKMVGEARTWKQRVCV